MAKASVKKSALRKGEREEAEPELPYEAGVMVLFSLKAEQVPPHRAQSSQGEDDDQLTITASLSDVINSGDEHYCNVRFACTRSAKGDQSEISLEATYGFIFKATLSPKLAAQEIARTVAWVKFCDLVGLADMHMRARLPPLPIVAPIDR